MGRKAVKNKSRAREQEINFVSKALAWGVHLYTASGLVLAAAIAVCIVQGTAEAFAWAFVFMWAATIVDATDGVLARRLQVKEKIPDFDGRRLDDLTDFLTYTCLPLLLVWRANLISGASAAWLLVPLLASAYGFCQVSAKTDDGFFLGFPSYWNLIAFYLYVLHFPSGWALASILFFAALTFVPARYLYSTQPGKLNQVTNVLAAIWTVFVGWILYRCLTDSGITSTGPGLELQRLAQISLIFPLYYMLTSWIITWKLRTK